MDERRLLTRRLWYTNPAENWHEALPIGNGTLGAMVFGGANRDVVSLNEDSLWGGHSLDRHNPKAREALPEVRRLLFEGRNEEASELAKASMVSDPRWPFPYQPLGDLIIEQRQSRRYTDYRRELSLGTALARVDYAMEGATYEKEYFTSHPDQVLAIRYTCDTPGRFSLSVRLARPENAEGVEVDDDTILFRGCGHEDGIHFCAALRVVPEGGSIEVAHWRKEGATLEIHDADTVTFYLTASTTFRVDDPVAESQRVLEVAVAKGYDSLRDAHMADYRALFDRFELDLSDPGEDATALVAVDTAERLEHFRAGGADPRLFALYTNYQRYLLISSSRPGSLPSNLQGIWNHRMLPPWESDFHTNVNFQINYWPAEGYNLAECHEPVFDWLHRMTVTGHESAQRIYGADGWVVHHATDIWGAASPLFDLLGIWPMGALWCSRDIFESYAHSLDVDLLRQRYPVLRGAVEFMLDFLVEAPEGTPWAGFLVTNPSHSPENMFVADDGSESWFTWAATMDIEIIHDLFGICLRFIDRLTPDGESDFDEAFRRRIEDSLDRLPPIQISQRTGGIQEWIFDYEEVMPEHRHVSHLYGVYPGTMITPDRTPELAEAAKRTIHRKYEHGYNSQGWSMGWIACIWARLREGNEAYDSLRTVAQRHFLHNLFIDAHGNPQVGDAQAVPAAILEMLAQSHDEALVLLPALPDAWPKGFVRGMRVRGDRELDMEWDAGRVVRAQIRSAAGSPDLNIRLANMDDYERVTNEGITELRLMQAHV